MRFHPLFIFAAVTAAFPAAAIDSAYSGAWTDIRTIENRLVIRSSAVEVPAWNAFTVDRRGNGIHSASGGAAWGSAAKDPLSLGVGPLKALGLPAAVSNPFGKAIAGASREAPLSFVLDTGASASGGPEAFVVLGLPPAAAWGRIGAFAAADDERVAAFALLGSGAPGARSVRVEVLYTQSNLPARTSDAWFSEKPPLPIREHRLWAGTAVIETPRVRFSAVEAFSETESQGNGAYAAIAGEATVGRLRAAVGGDAATPAFMDAEGRETGDKARCALDFAYRTADGAKLRFNAEGWAEAATRTIRKSAVTLAFQPPAGQRPASAFRLTEIAGETVRSVPIDEAASIRAAAAAKARAGRITTNAKGEISFEDDGSLRNVSGGLELGFPVSGARFWVSAKTVTDSHDLALFDASIGAAFAAFGGLFMARFGTDSLRTLSSLSNPGASASALGPWTLTVSWRFRERFEPRP